MPDNARTHTGRGTLFDLVTFVAPKAQGMVSWLITAFALRPRSHFFLTFFRWLEANRAEREMSQGRAFWARSSKRSADP
jgi:hypothetical protein